MENPQFDVMRYAEKYKNQLGIGTAKISLNELGEKLGIENPEAHRALADAITTARIFLKLKEMDYIELVRMANRCFPDFSIRLLKTYPDLTVTDFRHGCLALLGLNDAQIAVLEGISYSGSNRRTNKFISVLNLGDNLEQALLTYLRKNY